MATKPKKKETIAELLIALSTSENCKKLSEDVFAYYDEYSEAEFNFNVSKNSVYVWKPKGQKNWIRTGRLQIENAPEENCILIFEDLEKPEWDTKTKKFPDNYLTIVQLVEPFQIKRPEKMS